MSHSLAAVYSGFPGQIALQQIRTQTPRSGEVLVRILGCTLCGSDLHSLEGRRAVPIPTILGHEIVGEIVALGSDAPQTDITGRPIGLGSRVTWAIVANCGDCYFCRRDVPQKCLKAVKYGHEAFRPGEELLGGVAEHCLLVRGTSIVAIPEELPLEVACPASCATSTIAAALEGAGDLQDRTVCVLGAGMLGLTACAMARSRGASSIVCVDQQPQRRERSLAFGATEAMDLAGLKSCRETELLKHGFDVVLELTGSPQAFEHGWSHVRTGGHLVLVGAVFPSDPFPLPLEQVVRRQLTLTGIHNYAPRHLVQAINFLSVTHSRFPFAELVSHWVPLRECQSAFDQGREGHAIRVGVRP